MFEHMVLSRWRCLGRVMEILRRGKQEELGFCRTGLKGYSLLQVCVSSLCFLMHENIVMPSEDFQRCCTGKACNSDFPVIIDRIP